LSNERIEAHFKTSKMQLYRKLKTVTGWSVNSLIREVRITEAKKIAEKSGNEHLRNCLATGFFRPAVFQQIFQERSWRCAGTVPERSTESSVAFRNFFCGF
jgi:AraC-like DNA-binding protein